MGVVLTIDTIVLAALVAAAVLILVAWQASARPARGARNLPDTPQRSGLLAEPPAEWRPPATERRIPMTVPDPDGPYRDLPDNYVLAVPPQVPLTTGGNVSVIEFLRRYHDRGEKALMDVVMEMYKRAAGVPAVADYLRDADMKELPRHFHSVLKVITAQGMTVGLVRRMGTAHAHVTNSAGNQITPEVFDAVVGVLAEILAEQGLPEITLTQIGAAALPLRQVIAAGPVQPVRL